MLPLFTSEPADLVTVGSLQLASMGAQHPDAAEAAQLLRSLGNARDLVGSGLDLASLAHSLPFPMGDFNMSVLIAGLGLQLPVTPPAPPPMSVVGGDPVATVNDVDGSGIENGITTGSTMAEKTPVVAHDIVRSPCGSAAVERKER